MLGDGVGKEVWLIKSRADLASDVTWVVLQDGTKYAPFVASRDLNWHLIRHEGKGIMAKSCSSIQVLRAHIASGPERNKGWLRAIFDPQIGTALSAIHNRVNTPRRVESMAAAAGMSRSAFAARFKELLGQTPLEYVTEWRMQKRCSYYNAVTKSS